MVEPSPTVLAVDIGGTKIECGVVAADGTVVSRARSATAGDDAEALLELVASVADEALGVAIAAGTARPTVCGVGCGGPMSDHGSSVSPLNIPQWRGFSLRDRLATRFEMATFVDNDAKALALAEGWLGAAAGVADYIAMVVSTGVGGGIVSGGVLLDGADGNAGHIGHLVVNPGGREHAGIAGSLEGEASGTAIAAMTGEPAALASSQWRKRTGLLVGRAVGGVANLLDLRLAVVSGSVAFGYGAEFFEAAQHEIDRVASLDHSRGTLIVPGGLGADGPLIGAAAVAWYRSGVPLGELRCPDTCSPADDD
jgi:glucokinase